MSEKRKLISEKSRNIEECLTLAQIMMTEITEAAEILEEVETNANTGKEEFENGLKLTVNECLPKIRVYERKYGKYDHQAYQEARNRWLSLIKEALGEHHKEPIIKSIVWIKHYNKYLCDPDNFTAKFIIDALRGLGVIFHKDDGEHVSIIHTCMVDKENPRTEIIALKDENQLEKLLT